MTCKYTESPSIKSSELIKLTRLIADGISAIEEHPNGVITKHVYTPQIVEGCILLGVPEDGSSQLLLGVDDKDACNGQNEVLDGTNFAYWQEARNDGWEFDGLKASLQIVVDGEKIFQYPSPRMMGTFSPSLNAPTSLFMDMIGNDPFYTRWYQEKNPNLVIVKIPASNPGYFNYMVTLGSNDAHAGTEKTKYMRGLDLESIKWPITGLVNTFKNWGPDKNGVIKTYISRMIWTEAPSGWGKPSGFYSEPHKENHVKVGDVGDNWKPYTTIIHELLHHAEFNQQFPLSSTKIDSLVAFIDGYNRNLGILKGMEGINSSYRPPSNPTYLHYDYWLDEFLVRLVVNALNENPDTCIRGFLKSTHGLSSVGGSMYSIIGEEYTKKLQRFTQDFWGYTSLCAAAEAKEVIIKADIEKKTPPVPWWELPPTTFNKLQIGADGSTIVDDELKET